MSNFVIRTLITHCTNLFFEIKDDFRSVVIPEDYPYLEVNVNFDMVTLGENIYDICREYNVEVNYFEGNAAASPYVALSSECANKLKICAFKVQECIKNFHIFSHFLDGE